MVPKRTPLALLEREDGQVGLGDPHLGAQLLAVIPWARSTHPDVP